jgi:methionine synthase I (cobalamin-dependent)
MAESHFTEQVTVLLEVGVDLLLLETFGDVREFVVEGRTVRRLSDVSIGAQMVTGEDGLSADGINPEQFARTLSSQGTTIVWVNCGTGPVTTLESFKRMADATAAPLSAQPNADQPREVDGRYFVLSLLEFLASYVRRYVAIGVRRPATGWLADAALPAPRRISGAVTSFRVSYLADRLMTGYSLTVVVVSVWPHLASKL